MILFTTNFTKKEARNTISILDRIYKINSIENSSLFNSKKYSNLFNLLCQVSFLNLAFQVSGISQTLIGKDELQRTSVVLKQGFFRWDDSQELSLLTQFSSVINKVILVAIKIILKAIYDPILMDMNKRLQSNLTEKALYTLRYSSNCNNKMVFALKGVEVTQSSSRRSQLLTLMFEKKIDDNKFLRLIRAYLSSVRYKTILNSQSFSHDESFLELFSYLEKIFWAEFDSGMLVYLNHLFGDLRNFEVQKRSSPYELATFGKLTPNILELYFLQPKLKFRFIRYHENWIVFTNSSKILSEKIKDSIVRRSERFSSSGDISLINMKILSAHFLGFEFLCSFTKNNVKSRLPTIIPKSSKLLRQNFIQMYPDRQLLLASFGLKGFCDKIGFPISISWLSSLEINLILDKYNFVIYGLVNYYLEFARQSSCNRWIYILRFSFFKTLAQKYRSSIKKIIHKYSKGNLRYGKTVEVSLCINSRNGFYEKRWELFTIRRVLSSLLYLKDKKTN